MKKARDIAYLLFIIAATQVVAAGVMRVLGEIVIEVMPDAGYVVWVAVGGLGVFAAFHFLRGVLGVRHG